MKTNGVSDQARKLHSALVQRGVAAEIEKWDKHKHIDLSIEAACLHIEIDGDAHYTDADTMMRDLARDYYSSENGYDTIHIPNTAIDEQLDAVAAAVADVVQRRSASE